MKTCVVWWVLVCNSLWIVGWGSVWSCLRIFKIWVYFDFLLSEAAFTSFAAQVHMLVQSQRREKGCIRELVQLKVRIVEGDTVLFWFFYPTSSPAGLTRPMVGQTWFRRPNCVTEVQGYLRQPCCPKRLCLFLCFAHHTLIWYIDSSLQPKDLDNDKIIRSW